MQYSIVNYSELEKTSLRFDPEYYHPLNLTLYEKLVLKPHQMIGEFSYVTDGIHNPIQFDDESNINLISAKAPKDNYFDLSGCGRISTEQNSKNPRTRLKEDDVIVSSAGTIGNCAVVDKSILPANSDRHVGIIRIKNGFLPRFLSSFLLSKYGRFQTYRESTGNVQLNLFVYKIKEIIVPNLSKDFQEYIENVCIEANYLILSSDQLYSQAEQVLLSELGLLDWKPKHQLSFVRNYSDIESAERFDAEYFQPMYDEIENYIRSYENGNDLLRNQFKQNKKTFKIEPEREYQYVEIGCVNISDGSIDPLQLRGDELPTNAKIKLLENDLIVSTVRPYRGAIGIVDSNNYVGSGAFTVLQECGGINKETLMVFLRSKPMLSYSLKFNTGTSYPVITDNDILNFSVPIIRQEKQEQIKSKINEIRKAKYESRKLLEIAKRGVELAIEENEVEAEKWINEELLKWSVSHI